ncbi:MAG: hypothetical protein A2Y20_02285 [Firmicutes bacterium GWF2_51_9]|nr:MAG: hypothetical protein A2Y20_02285 [Firmicutes bacterium GWF2_51_9]OGS59173.1 MAG: hypothetical protein A2Y19_00810 [Firmicutes bacterium GWE2_51_13]HAM62150.1 hypothetical protein [Erysipelotrichaceae bacterium]HBZ41735.1 hypothetical protein [Erysipelotrichaceae bacterium]
MNHGKGIRTLVYIIAVLTVVITSIGIFYQNEGVPYEFINMYGQTVKMFGNGMYAFDSYFRAPIFKGSDAAMLFVGVPGILLAEQGVRRKHTKKSLTLLVGMMGIFAYYSASIAFGVTYNTLHLAYVLLFSASLFGLIFTFIGINPTSIDTSAIDRLPLKGIRVFLFITGIALFVAWLPDILLSLVNREPLALIEVYTTEITYVLDMGIISPSAFLCLALLKKKSGLSIPLLSMILLLCAIMGVMLPLQTVFQLFYGIVIPIPVLVTKVGIFVVLACFAVHYELKLLQAIRD